MTDDNDEGYCLVMPFVTCQSNGGPHDDASYVAGWAMGSLSQQLAAANTFGLPLPAVNVLVENVPMVDLIAMDAGLTVHRDEYPDDVPDAVRAEWTLCRFERAS